MQFPIVSEIDPSKLFYNKSKNIKENKPLILLGIMPKILLLDISKYSK